MLQNKLWVNEARAGNKKKIVRPEPATQACSASRQKK